MNHILRRGKKVGIAVAGAIIILVGIILVPYPGPGWLVIFSGLAILSTEFSFAAKVLAWLKTRYEAWTEWVKRQPKIIEWLILVFTGLVIVVTIWLLNTFGFIDSLLHLNQDWLHSPLFRK